MSYKALYRTYRPVDFTEVAGQKHITTTLKNALKNGKVAHAYLFSGPRGTGKTTIAKILAKAVNCVNSPTDNPCNKCANCLGIQDGSISDVIEIDAASNNGVDEIREIRDKVRYLPGYVKYKVYIIDEVHMLSTGAFNALLKTLEEPPAHVIFILCTTEPQKIPLTIHSRCQRFDFKAITPHEITDKLHEIIDIEHIQIEDEAVDQIAIYAEGGLRDALGLLDQAYSYSPNFIRIDDVNQICGALSLKSQMEIVEAILKMNAAEAIQLMDELMVAGKEPQKICQNMIQFFRDILVYKNVGFNESTPKLYQNDGFSALAKSISNRRIFFYLDILNKAANDIKWSNNPRLYLELAFIKMTDSEPESDAKIWKTFSDLESRVHKVEQNPISERIVEKKIEEVNTVVKKPVEHASIINEIQTEETLDIEDLKPEEPELDEIITLFEQDYNLDNKLNELTSEKPLYKEVSKESALDDLSIQNTEPIKPTDLSKTYRIDFVEDVLNNGNRDDKNYLIEHWNQLKRANPTGVNEQYATLLQLGELKASSFDKIIVVFESPAMCNRLMKPSVKLIMTSVIKNAFDRDIDYIALPKTVFQSLSEEFAYLWRQGKRDIKLSPIVHPELRDVSKELDESATKSEGKIISDAMDIFGDLVRIKK